MPDNIAGASYPLKGKTWRPNMPQNTLVLCLLIVCSTGIHIKKASQHELTGLIP